MSVGKRLARSPGSSESRRSSAFDGARLGLVVVSLFLLALPLGAPKPGLPSTLKADEPAYFLMSLSLVHDQDVRCEVKDLHRLFAEFPYGPAHNLVLTSDDGWHTVYFGKPFVYPLLAAPFAALWGSNGLTMFNMLLFVAMIWMGAIHLERFNERGFAALFSAAFFLLSVAWSYVFWLQPEIFNMASVAAGLFFGLGIAPWPKSPFGQTMRRLGPALGGAALALGAYNKPMLLIFALPVWAQALSESGARSWGDKARAVGGRMALWAAGGLSTLAILTLISLALTGHPSPYLGGERAGHEVFEPNRMPVEPTASGSVDEIARLEAKPGSAAVAAAAQPAAGPEVATAAAAPAQPRRTWWWIFRIPDVPLREAFENFGYFLFGRHTGLLLYMPFAFLAVLSLVRGERPPERWALLAACAGLAVFFLLWIPFNWHGGGGFVGNRYYVNGYPAFLFLVAAVVPRWSLAVVAGWASLSLGTLVVTPFGRPVAFPTLQAHVRAPLYRAFPLELSLRGIPGYLRTAAADLGVVARRDQVLSRGDSWWLHGATPVEIWLQSAAPIEELVLQVRSPVTENRIALAMGDAGETLEATDTEWRRVVLRPGDPERTRLDEGRLLWVYRLVVESSWGEVQKWTAHNPPPRADYFAYQESSEESFFAGAELRILGTGADLARDVFVAQWKGCELPRGSDLTPGSVVAGSQLQVPVTLVNASGSPWPARGVARVALSYHWRRTDSSDEQDLWDGERTALPKDVGAGESVDARVKVVVPTVPGAWELSLDAVREEVGWFSERGVAPCRGLVTVIAAPSAS